MMPLDKIQFYIRSGYHRPPCVPSQYGKIALPFVYTLICLDTLVTYVIMGKFSYMMGDKDTNQLQGKKNCNILLVVFMFCPSAYLDQPIILSIAHAVFF